MPQKKRKVYHIYLDVEYLPDIYITDKTQLYNNKYKHRFQQICLYKTRRDFKIMKSKIGIQ